MKNIITIALFAAFFALSACSSDEKKTEAKTPQNPSDIQLYKEGKAKLDGRYHQTAIRKFEEIERLYPFSKLATKAKVMIAYAYYKDEEYGSAIGVIDSFVRLHPVHPDVAYMYYLKALSYYDRITDIKRDQKVTKQALSALNDVIRRFKDTKYARDAKFKIDLVYDHLAGKEMEIGRFYLKQNKYIAAINRFKNVVDEYDNTSQIEEALYRLVEGNLSVGLTQEAQKYAALLGHNYPQSKWYKYAYTILRDGKNSVNTRKKWFKMPSFGFGDDKPKKATELPKENESKKWLDKIWNVF